MEPTPRDRRPDGDVPFGLPVLAEVPELATVLEQLVAVDRLLARAVEGLIGLQDHHVAETVTGVALEQWLATLARRTGSDRRMLQTAAAVCRRLPALRSAFGAAQVSWSQVRAVALKVERLPGHLDDRLDAAIADAIAGAADADPDALARVVGWVVTDLDDRDVRPDRGAPDRDVLVLQPRLDGSGGTIWGDFGPAGFAVLDAATDPGPTGPRTRDRFGDRPDPQRAAAGRTVAGQARAARLIDRCRRQDGAVVPPTLLLRAELSTLVGADGRPSQLLTSLAGGVMHVDGPTARRLADLDGADVRLVVTDGGKVVGVGRRRRQPPGWLAEATLAVHDTCSEPGCLTAARVCDVDHAVPWDAGGATDVANLAPLCATANHRKEPDGWQTTQTADGVRTWHHPRTGLTTRTIPATWRPPPRPGHRGPPTRGRPALPAGQSSGPRSRPRSGCSRLEQHLHTLLTARPGGDTGLPF